MKNSIMVCVFLFGSFLTFSQKECKDMIYTFEGDRIIFDCCIKEVKNGNIVYYAKDGDTAHIAATAITKGGQHIELITPSKSLENKNIHLKEVDGLYKDHDYKYYQTLYYGSRTRQGFGVFFTILGVGLEIGGYVISGKDYATSEDIDQGSKLVLAGSILETIGIPLWISGCVRKKNNWKAMMKIERNKDLSFGINANGVGLTLRF